MPTPKFKEGHEKTGGRKKGSLNKFTTLKDAFLGAFKDERIGGQEGLSEVYGKSDISKKEFFKLISKMLPSTATVSGEDGAIIPLQIMFVLVNSKQEIERVEEGKFLEAHKE